MAAPVRPPPYGMALFSTRRGKYPSRQAVPNMSIVLRSDPMEDRDSMARKLQAEFPDICNDIYIMPDVGDLFDHYDQELHGIEFLRAVVAHIVSNNAIKVEDYVENWMAANTEAFALLTLEHHLEHLFTEEDINEYGQKFLEIAMAQIRYRKDLAERRGKLVPSRLLSSETDTDTYCRGCSDPSHTSRHGF